MAINKITVDYDIINLRNTLWKLLKNYIYACLKFGRNNVRVYVTSSKRGFRLEISNIETDVLTNLLERAVMDDDPYRIFFSLKRYAESGKEEDVDVAFYSKVYVKTNQKGSIQEIPIEEIIGKENIEKLEQYYATQKFEEILLQIIDDLEKKFLEFVKPMKVAYIIISKDYLDEFIEKISNYRVRYKVMFNVYEPEKPIVRLIGDEKMMKEIIDEYVNSGKITKYKFVEEYSKN